MKRENGPPMTLMTPSQRFREVLLLWTLAFLPGQGGGITPLILPGGLLTRALAQAVFAVLVVHLLDVQGEASLLTPAGTARRGKTLLMAGGIALVLLSLAVALATAVNLLPGSGGYPLPESLRPGALPATHMAGVPGTGPARVGTLALMAGSLVAIAYAEELFFRAYLMIRLAQTGLQPAQALVISATLFALVHQWQGPGAMLFAWISGLFLGGIWIIRPGIHHLALGHAAYNGLALLISALGAGTL
ncbi:CPBP family intramembrane glutamic endopeptidase [Alkalispirochaeta alkalica]|uniref:CPBP family intramembrane glutamic endopeptidase n=1 Tax=Alkalispirochaeta alkalica TaxID=46356 RepID=UPI0012FDD321|nr:CPBP family intramembrane glutamic endopeptidase [Alkalispirochaeta alkalica]